MDINCNTGMSGIAEDVKDSNIITHSTPLFFAAFKDHQHVMTYLLENEASVVKALPCEDEDMPLLHRAVYQVIFFLNINIKYFVIPYLLGKFWIDKVVVAQTWT